MLVAFSTGASAFYPGFPPPGYPGQPYTRMYPDPPPQGVHPYPCLSASDAAIPLVLHPTPVDTTRSRCDTSTSLEITGPCGGSAFDTVVDDEQAGAGGDTPPSTDAARFIESLLPLIETENQRILARPGRTCWIFERLPRQRHWTWKGSA